MRRPVQGQGGSTLIELLLAMPLAVLILGVVFAGFAAGSRDQARVEARSEAVAQAQQGLERMTRALRQADWVYFRSSGLVDALTMVRSAPGTAARPRLVRFDCTAGACLRLTGPATGHPPPRDPAFESREVLVGGGAPGDPHGRVANADVFVPRSVDPATGAPRVDYVSPRMLDIRLVVQPAAGARAVEIVDGVTLRNAVGR